MIRVSTKPISYYFALVFAALFCLAMEVSPWWLIAPAAVLTAVLWADLRELRRLRPAGPDQTLRFQLRLPTTMDLQVPATGTMEWEWMSPTPCELEAWRVKTHDMVELRPLSSNPATSGWPPEHFQVMPRRLGTWNIDSVEAHFSSPRGFWTRTMVVATSPAVVRIHPPVHPLSTEDFLDLFSQAPRLVEGRRRRSASREPELFHSLRRFQTGDPVRNIDARRSALVGQPMVRTFESHRDHHLVICLDLGRGMLGMIGESRKLDYYISAMNHLIRSAVAQGDRVSVIGFDQQVRFQYRASKNLATFAHLIETADQLQANPIESDFDRLAEWILPLAQTRAIVVLMSDVESPSVQDHLHRSLRHLTHKHLTAILGLSEPLNDPQISLHELTAIEPAPTDSQIVTHPAYANLLYAMHIRTQLLDSQKRWTQFGANCVVVDRTRWMSATHALYTQLRASQFA